MLYWVLHVLLRCVGCVLLVVQECWVCYIGCYLCCLGVLTVLHVFRRCIGCVYIGCYLCLLCYIGCYNVLCCCVDCVTCVVHVFWICFTGCNQWCSGDSGVTVGVHTGIMLFRCSWLCCMCSSGVLLVLY